MLTNYYNQIFCPQNQRFSVIIEDDGKVAYAYLLKEKKIIGDVWLYNNLPTPKIINWTNKEDMPFLNPKVYINAAKKINPILEDRDVKIVWSGITSVNKITAKILIRENLIALLNNGSRPGWSSLVIKDGPLAKKMIHPAGEGHN